MPFEIPTRDELADEFLERHAAELPEYDISRGSDPYRLARVVSGLVWSAIAKGVFLERNMLPDLSEGEWLLRWANLYDIPREGAAPSQGVSALRVTGVIGTVVPLAAELAHADGTLFVVASAGVIGGGGTADVDVASTTRGVIANKVTGEKLTFTTPITDLQAEAELVADLTGGLDLETEASWRARVLEAIAVPAEGGAVHDYAKWARSVAGVKEAFVWRHRRGLGTVDIAVLQDGHGEDRIIVDTSAVTAAIDGPRPATVKDSLVLTVLPNHQGVTVELEIDTTRFAWDWDDGGVGTAVTAINAGQKKVTVAGLTAAVVAGKRIQILGEQREVTARAGDELTLDSWFAFNPLAEDVRAGGDLVLPVQRVIQGMFNALGPTRGDYAALPWTDTLKLVHLIAAIDAVDGVEDFTVVSPVGNLTPADPRDSTIYLLVPGAISVFKA